MSLTKSFFKLAVTCQMIPFMVTFGKLIYENIKQLNDYYCKYQVKKNMDNYPEGKASISREQIVLPLLTIQQYALKQIQELKNQDPSSKEITIYEKIVDTFVV